MTELDKKKLSQAVLEHFLHQDQLIGIGSGTMIRALIDKLVPYARSLSQYTQMSFLGSSIDSDLLCQGMGLNLRHYHQLAKNENIDIYFDGADYIDGKGDIIKGKGGAMLREKILAYSANKVVILAELKKYVSSWDQNIYIPLEIFPFAWKLVEKALTQFHSPFYMRYAQNKLGPLLSDNANFIVDLEYPSSYSFDELIQRLDAIPGIFAHGLFQAQKNQSWYWATWQNEAMQIKSLTFN